MCLPQQSWHNHDMLYQNGCCPLILASENGHENVVKLLLLYKAKQEVEDMVRNSPADIATPAWHFVLIATACLAFLLRLSEGCKSECSASWSVSPYSQMDYQWWTPGSLLLPCTGRLHCAGCGLEVWPCDYSGTAAHWQGNLLSRNEIGLFWIYFNASALASRCKTSIRVLL